MCFAARGPVIAHIKVHRYKALGKFDQDLNLRPKPIDDGLDIGKSSPYMAARFRLVKYCNLPRYLAQRNVKKR